MKSKICGLDVHAETIAEQGEEVRLLGGFEIARSPFASW
jgi:hypothetical protein